MKTYILALIIFFSVILLNNFLTMREGLACLDNSSISNYNLNSDNIVKYQGQMTDFLGQVQAAENAVYNNTVMMGNNFTNNNAMKTAICPEYSVDDDGDIPSSELDLPGSWSVEQQKHKCSLACAGFSDETFGNVCNGPWNIKGQPRDDSHPGTDASSVPTAAQKAAGVSEGPPSEKALEGI